MRGRWEIDNIEILHVPYSRCTAILAWQVRRLSTEYIQWTICSLKTQSAEMIVKWSSGEAKSTPGQLHSGINDLRGYIRPSCLTEPVFRIWHQKRNKGISMEGKKNIDNYVNSDALVVQQKHWYQYVLFTSLTRSGESYSHWSMLWSRDHYLQASVSL